MALIHQQHVLNPYRDICYVVISGRFYVEGENAMVSFETLEAAIAHRDSLPRRDRERQAGSTARRPGRLTYGHKKIERAA
jgi:hypothetical protein